MTLMDLPAELRQHIGHFLGDARDAAACLLAHPQLLARPLLYWLDSMRPSIPVGDVLSASAPLDIVVGLFARWRVEALPEMVVDAAIGGRLDVLRWVLSRLDAASLVDCEIRHSRSPGASSLSADDDHLDGGDDDGLVTTYYGGVLIAALKKAAERDRADILACLLTEAPPPGRVPSPPLLDAISVDAAARGSLGILATLHKWRLEQGHGVCGCPAKMGHEAMHADRVDVLEWLAAVSCTGALVLSQTTLDDVPSHPLPRFTKWAVAKLPPDVRVGPTRLERLAASDCVETLKILHETGLGVCSKETLCVAATHGSIDVLAWAAGNHPGTMPLAAWNPIDVAIQAASHGRKDVIQWLATRPDANRVLTVPVARVALAHNFVETAAAVRPLDQWDALAAAASHNDLYKVADVVYHGARCTTEAMAAAMRCRDERILELLCRKYGTEMIPGAVESAVGTRCSLNCVRWLSDAIVCRDVPDSVCVAHLWASAAVEWPDGAQSCCMCLRCNPYNTN
ncbi:hypothetical protein psal_cds_165 [Pandoravirus salinus]|uniref:Ankyrin repeat domain containing protein n=1 Tax=Pandoravirus salinus TaxID=1349410 RepID=S4VT64_9VIRU|nr:hypothetical protein psal_cds_165 [Pandoravirus salinus]AGO83649.1 hypothetical protein psal_cds_165 [Pandoravirus salinus]